jgi:hypothetical protein
MYLDLSSTQGVRNHYVLRYIGSLSDLTVLKLSNCGLRDDDIEVCRFSLSILVSFVTTPIRSQVLLEHSRSIREYSGDDEDYLL